MTIDFYDGYRRDYKLVHLQKKHVKQFDHEFARSSGFSPEMSVLELGCGNGLFLQYLEYKGAKDFLGIDQDAELLQCMPDTIANRFHIGDFWDVLAKSKGRRHFDRVVLFDVLEHFPAEKGGELLHRIGEVLAPDGAIIARFPNLSSPWGPACQFNDLTHKTAFTPGSIAQLAEATGFRLAACLPQVHSNRWKQAREQFLHGILSWFLISPPQIWSAQMVAVLRKK